ncbi:hypothetical protein [Actinobacillus genomosp. 1]|uniref:hypothetical protein n=1 Tax=Actinobacillus genomosp. 1 TaxID=254839 RepID=UPI002441CDF9|nr:hypothetical protein [Actinobacillus genomosp. 1]WGE90431.1 hypothetical protein NYR63_06175 [Actinobacillus genomosp. 1]
MEDFIDFYPHIDSKFLKNKEFSYLIVKFFFSLNLEFRNKNNVKEALSVLEQDNELKNLNIFQLKTWEDILLSKYIKDEINSEIGKLVYFQNNSKPSWLYLWDHRTLSESEFNENLKDVLSKFDKLEYDELPILTHVFNLLILFANENISDLSIESIEKKVDEYLNKFSSNPDWFEVNYSSPLHNGTGYGYTNEKDENVIRIKNKITITLNDRQQFFYKKSKKDNLIEILSLIGDGNYDEYYSKLDNYKYKSIFNQVDKNILIDVIGSDNAKILHLLRILDDRYSVSNPKNTHHLLYFYDEKIILELLKEILDEKNENNDLSQFDKYNCEKNMIFLEKILKRFDNHNQQAFDII